MLVICYKLWLIEHDFTFFELNFVVILCKLRFIIKNITSGSIELSFYANKYEFITFKKIYTKFKWHNYNGNVDMGFYSSDVIMGAVASQITSLTIVYSTVYSGARKHQSSASLAILRGIHRWPVNSPHKGPVTRKMFHLITSSWGCLFCWYYCSCVYQRNNPNSKFTKDDAIFNALSPDVAHTRRWTRPSLAQAMACCHFGQQAVFFSIGPRGTNLSEILSKIQQFQFRKMHLMMLSAIFFFVLDLLNHILYPCHVPQFAYITMRVASGKAKICDSTPLS